MVEDLTDRRGRVDQLVRRDAGKRAAEHDAGHVTACLLRRQTDRLEPVPDHRDVLDADPVQLDVLTVGHVGAVPGVGRRDVGDRPQLLGRQLTAVDPDPEHEVLVVELVRLEDGGTAAVDAGLALRVEAPPPEAAAQVGGVDRGEASVRVDVLDAGSHVERVVVLLGLLVGVERLAVSERPLALTLAGPGAGGPDRRWRWWCWGVSCESSGEAARGRR